MGYAKGGSLENAIVVDQDKIINPEGLRFDEEFVCHKILDVVGDMALCGYQMNASYSGYKTSHKINNILLHELFNKDENYELVEA
jgi:UDP-3-O-[3-hydroxymyristoyl] N-acetylglucosamine deacetylase